MSFQAAAFPSEVSSVTPISIIAFERRMLVSVVVFGILNISLNYDKLATYASTVELWVVTFLSVGFTVTLVLLVSRKRNVIAKWILIALFVVSLPKYVSNIVNNDFNLPTATHGIQLLQTAMQAIALGLLFTPGARSWVTKGTGAGRIIFTLVVAIATTLTFILNVIETWQGSASVPTKLLINVTLDVFLAAIWPITWMIWAVWAWLGHPTPLSFLW